MTIFIRQALIEDASAVAPLIYDAIGEIACRLTGAEEEKAILTELALLVTLKTNRHSYLNTYVAVREAQILGIVVLYDGLQGALLDQQLEQFLKDKFGQANPIDSEAYEDEFYIDTICVASEARGMGIGTKLLQFAEQTAREKGYTKLSLNVELEKHAARQLYERLGFKRTEQWIIINEPFHHMVKELD